MVKKKSDQNQANAGVPDYASHKPIVRGTKHRRDSDEPVQAGMKKMVDSDE